MAWTAIGGEVLFIEALRMKGKGNLVLTGQLGDVMKESAQAAFSFAKSRARELGINEDDFNNYDMHLHIPEGAIPKDGPSAGVTMATALASLISGRPVRSDTAMTGELTLTGQVLPIGGLKEKALAAQDAEIRRVIAPKRNEQDIDEIPEHLRKEMEFIFVERIEEVLNEALVPEPQADGKRAAKRDVAEADGAKRDGPLPARSERDRERAPARARGRRSSKPVRATRKR